MTKHLFREYGGLGLPFLDSDLDASNLNFDAADPAKALMLDLFEASINAELNPDDDPSWTAACATLAADSVLANSTTPVADKIAVEPSPDIMKQRKAAFPLLAIHRTGESTTEDHTLETPRLRQNWHLHWILGSLDAGSWMKLNGACQFVAKVIRTVIRMKGHPDYEDGALQFFNDSLDGPHPIGAIRMLGYTFGQAVFAEENQPMFYALRCSLETVEYHAETLGSYADITGMDISAGVGNAYEIVPDLVKGDTNYPGDMYEP